MVILYLFVLMYDFQNIYYMAKSNSDSLSAYSDYAEIVQYEEKEDDVMLMVDTKGDELSAESPNLGIVLGDSDVAFYVESENILLQSTGKSYWLNFLIGSNAIPVVVCWSVIFVLLVIARKVGSFSVLSKNWTLRFQSLVGVFMFIEFALVYWLL